VATLATRNVILSQHQHEIVESLVKSGRYQNATEVLREGLRLVEREQAEEVAKFVLLRRAADQGWSVLAAGRFDKIDDEGLDDLIGQLGGRDPVSGLMSRYRRTHTAQTDISSILTWSHDQFGEEARKRYEALITTAIRDAATRSDDVGFGRTTPGRS